MNRLTNLALGTLAAFGSILLVSSTGAAESASFGHEKTYLLPSG